MKYYVGIDIGGTKINIGILNAETELIANRITPVPVAKDCIFENIPKMYEAGADVFVVGTSSVFHKDYTYETAIEKVLNSLE